MSSSVSASPFQVLQAPRRPPLLPVTAVGDLARWAATYRDALRATVPSTACFWSGARPA